MDDEMNETDRQGYHFRCVSGGNKITITFSFSEDSTLEDLVDGFEGFLRSAGFGLKSSYKASLLCLRQ